MLTGDSVVDLSLCKQSKVIIGQPSQWDSLSRKWRTRKVVQQIGLYIFLDIHTIYSENGSAYEIVVSRSRFIESQLGKNCRFLGVGYSVANAGDVADWLGVAKNLIFNFSKQTADSSADVHLMVRDNHDPINRVSGMSKLLYRLMKTLNGASVVFVPSRKLAQMLAIDILFFVKSQNDGSNNNHLYNPENWMGCNFSESTRELISNGIGVIYGGLSDNEINSLYLNLNRGILWVLIVPFEYGRKGKFSCNNTLITDTMVYDGKINSFVDVPAELLLDMASSAVKKCYLFCHSSKKDDVDRIFFEPLPVESCIVSHLHSHLVGEIVNRTVESKAEAVDYLTWTFYYRRLAKNPNYYNLSGSSVQHISDHLSELVESIVQDLEQSKFIAVENDMDLSPLNLAMISSHYNLHYLTVELFASSLTQKSRIKGIIDVLTHAQEFDDIPIRVAEDQIISQLIETYQLLSSDQNILQQKILCLLYAHFSRSTLNSELICDLRMILDHSINFLHAIVDVLSSQGWLKPTLAAMELSQMVVQGMWDKDDTLLQIPHFSMETVDNLHGLEPPVETIFDLLDLDDDVRSKVLAFPSEKLSDIASFCNSYPIIEVSYEMSFDEKAEAASQQTIVVEVERDISGFENMASVGRVVSHRYPSEKFENWWIVLGESTSNLLLSIKRFTLVDKAKVRLPDSFF